MLAERCWCPDQRFDALDLQFRREPRLSQYPGLGPPRRGEVVLCGKMLCERRQQRIPPLITDRCRLVPRR